MPTSPTLPAAPKQRATPTPVRTLARHAVEGLLDKKGLDVLVLDVRAVSGITDYLLLATAESELQVRAMVDAVRAEVRDATGERPWHVEGTDFHQWVVLDYVDLVVHIFQTEKRAFYALERLYGDAPMETVPETATADDVALLRDDAPDPVPPSAVKSSAVESSPEDEAATDEAPSDEAPREEASATSTDDDLAPL